MTTKIRQIFPLYRVLSLIALVVLIVLSASGFLHAQAVTQGYATDEKLQRGMLVRLKESDTSKVEAVKVEEADKMHGVVVDANDAAVTLSAEGEKVFVATTGRYEVLVSDQHGPIRPGDYIAVSALQGIGSFAGDREPYVIGKALEGFDEEENFIGTTELGEEEVRLGRILADIQVARNPLQKSTSNLPEFLNRAAENIAGKPVNTTRVYLSVVVFFMSAAIAASLLYGAVKAGITSVGRNPLSKTSIVRGMLQVIIVGLTIFISGILGVYLLLRL